MEKCLKNKIAIAVFEEICAEDLNGTAPKPDPPEDHPCEKRPRRAGEDIPYEKVVMMTEMAREVGPSRAERNWKKVHHEDVARQTFQKYLAHYQEKAKDKYRIKFCKERALFMDISTSCVATPRKSMLNGLPSTWTSSGAPLTSPGAPGSGRGITLTMRSPWL